MAFLQAQFFSEALNVASTVNVVLPERRQGIGIAGRRGDAPPPVLYLLHGYSDDHSIWMRRTSVERYAARYGLAVVMPAVNHSFYANEAQGERYWDYVSGELPEVMQRFFRLSCSAQDTYVAGLSMGGYGALKLAMTYPERFAAAGSFSGAVDPAALCSAGGGAMNRAQFERVFGPMERFAGSENDLFALMGRKAPSRPRLYVSCGTADGLYPLHERLVPALAQNGWDVTRCDASGEDHTWEFWDAQVERFIAWALEAPSGGAAR